MLEKIIGFSLKYKLIVILFTLSIAGFGIFAIINIPVGAVPDITNNQVQVITTSGNLSTQEIEQFITAPVELEMANLPGVLEIRSVSKFGLSVVTIVFRENLGTFLPRQLIAEKIKSASANIPEGFGTPEMGPITTGLGEIYQYTLDVKPGYEDRYSAMDLRTIQDWIVRRQLSGIDGVVEVNSWGGYLKQYEIAVNPTRLQSLNITLLDVFNALESNNSISGGAYIEKNAESYFIRGDGQVKSLEDIEQIVVKNQGGVPVLIRDVATVHFGFANRHGAITANGEGEKVLGQIMMIKDGNSKKIIREVRKRVNAVQNNLPEGVYINPVLDRSELIGRTTTTVFENLVFGFLIVFLVVLLLLGNLRTALLISSMIPLALLFTLSLMYIFGIDANLMSLGALDFGIIIDGAVIIVEFTVVRMTANKAELERLKGDERQLFANNITLKSVSSMMESAVFGQIIILIVFIPILALKGVEGKMFHPMALAFSFAIIGAMILCFTWLPVISSIFLRPLDLEKENLSHKLINFAKKSYLPVLRWSCQHKGLVFSLSFASLILSIFVLTRIGAEFTPTLDEGDFVIQPVLKTGTSLTKTIELTTQMENILMKKFPEVDKIVSRIGAAEVPTDPMSMEEIDMIIRLKPKKEWTTAKSKEELADKFKEALNVIPGIEYEFTQPIEMRFNELVTGVRADIAVKIFGEDLEYLNTKGEEIRKLIEGIPGAADIILEKTTGLPQMNVKYNRSKVAYYGLDISSLNHYLSIAFGGEVTGSVFEGERRFDMVVRLGKDNRMDISDIQSLQVPIPNGAQIPLSEVAEIQYTDGPAKISRENTRRRVVVSVNVRNRDLQSVVDDIRAKIDQNVKLNAGTYIAYGGQFENLQNATRTLAFVVPLALALIFIFLHFAFKSMKDAIMIFTAIPLSIVGGVFALLIRGLPFSISAGVGFIALFGVAVLNGIVLIEHLKHLKEKGMTDMQELIMKGTSDRLRPVILTASAAAMGFLPMAVSTGAGAEVQRPLATVVIGGLITSTLLTMIVLPLLFKIFHDDEGLKYKFVRKFKLKNFIIPLALLVSSGISAQMSTLTLEECTDLALKNNKEISAYRLKIDERKALAAPIVRMDKTIVYYGYDQANVAENGHPLRTVGVEQTFLFPTIHGLTNQMNQMDVKVSEFELLKQELILSKNIAASYYAIQFFNLKERYFQKIDSLYQALQSMADTQFRLGDISQLERLNAQAKKQQSALEIKKIVVEKSNSYRTLKSYMQTDLDFKVSEEEMKLIPVKNNDIYKNPDVQLLQLRSNYLNTSTKAEQQRLMPDISLGYFYGNNRFENARGYHGFQVGLGIPLFWGDQRSKVKAGKIAVNANELLLQNELNMLETKHNNLQNELKKFQETIEFYNKTGKQLNDEIIRSASKSYQAGEIGFYEFVISMENAMKLTLDYYEAVSEYNRIVLDINYLMR